LAEAVVDGPLLDLAKHYFGEVCLVIWVAVVAAAVVGAEVVVVAAAGAALAEDLSAAAEAVGLGKILFI
jgi:hypothetical protein